MTDTPQCVWQQPDWPNFTFETKVVALVLSKVRSTQGRVLGKAQALGLANLGPALARAADARAPLQLAGGSISHRVRRCQEGQVGRIAYPHDSNANRERPDRARERAFRSTPIEAPSPRTESIPGLVSKLA